jgi:heme A synthase
MINVTAIMTTGIVFATIYGLFYLFIRRRERLSLIEKGMDASIFYQKNKNTSYISLRYGMLFIGVGVGILLGNILAVTTNLYEEVAYFSMIFLGGGIALVANYLIEKKEKANQQ